MIKVVRISRGLNSARNKWFVDGWKADKNDFNLVRREFNSYAEACIWSDIHGYKRISQRTWEKVNYHLWTEMFTKEEYISAQILHGRDLVQERMNELKKQGVEPYDPSRVHS